jgi:hypothetical protein
VVEVFVMTMVVTVVVVVVVKGVVLVVQILCAGDDGDGSHLSGDGLNYVGGDSVSVCGGSCGGWCSRAVFTWVPCNSDDLGLTSLPIVVALL